MNYETPGGMVVSLDRAPLYARAMHADLVAALEIARAYQTRCERIETEYRGAAKLWSEENTYLANRLLEVTAERDTWRGRYTTEVPWP